MKNKKNIFLLTIDALGADKCWKLRDKYTYNLTRILSKGAYFSNAFSTTSSTTPSLASVHTGLYPRQHGIESTYGYQINNSVRTLAGHLKKNGYMTFANTGGPLNPDTRLNRKFDQYNFRPAHFMVPFFKYRFPINVSRINSLRLNIEMDKIFQSKQPWFYWVHLLDLHNRWRPKRRKEESGISDYEHAMMNLNTKLGKILNKINFENTLVIVVGDHGHHVAELDPKRKGIDYREAHGFHLYDTLVNVPLAIIQKDSIPEGLRIKKQVSTVDILPTIMDLLQCNDNIKTSGRSLIKFIDNKEHGEKNDSEYPVYFEACGSILKKQKLPFLRGIRKPKWKLIIPKEEKYEHPKELYDLQKDPDEQNNVYKEFPDVARQLKYELMDLVAKH